MGKSSNDQVGWLHLLFNLETHPDGVTLPDRLANFGLDSDIETLPASRLDRHEHPSAELVVETLSDDPSLERRNRPPFVGDLKSDRAIADKGPEPVKDILVLAELSQGFRPSLRQAPHAWAFNFGELQGLEGL